MPVYFFYTMVQKKSNMTKNQGGPALSSANGSEMKRFNRATLQKVLLSLKLQVHFHHN